MILGLSFLATPVKFTADSLTRPVALDVGRVTFQLMNRMELGFTAVLIVVIVGIATRSRLDTVVGVLGGLIVVIVAVQTLWLLPELYDRVQIVIDGEPLPDSPVHMTYTVLEGTKFLALLLIAFRRPVRR